MSASGGKRSGLKKLLDSLRRRFRKSPPSSPADDPYSYVMAPVRRGPRGRSGAAVAEPEDDSYPAFPPRRQ
jgi:hypothetical protein